VQRRVADEPGHARQPGGSRECEDGAACAGRPAPAREAARASRALSSTEGGTQ
jgi:hypothetical protein